MTDKFHNPFLAPKAPQQERPTNNQAPMVPQSSPTPAPAPQQPRAPQMPANEANMASAPLIDPMANPFAAPQAPAVSQAPISPVMTPAQSAAPLQPPTQPAIAPQMQAPQAPPIAPQISAPPPQTQPQAAQPQAQPQTMSAPQSVVRETASNPQAPLKTPNPFDFANQNGGTGGNKSTPEEENTGVAAPRYRPLRFTGGVGEFYGVVILNYLLTLITLGIYAPWAKVRKQRYFFSHTKFLNEGFLYLATGKQLFVGRIVAILVLVALSIAEFIPVIGVVLSIFVLLCGLPYVLNRSVRFNARNLAWRDVRFGWHGSFGMAFLVWMIYPLLSFFTLGLAQPLAARALRRHFAENHSFGEARFSADLGLGAFYIALLKATIFALVLMGIFGGLSVAIMFASLGDVFKGISSYEELMLLLALLPDEQKALLALPLIAIGFAFYLSGQYYFALVRHVMINQLRLEGGIRVRSQLSAFKYAMVIISNLLINIITLGFAHPYTIVRRYRYLTQSIEVRPIANMAGFIDVQTNAGFSVFEEVSDIEGLSIDI